MLPGKLEVVRRDVHEADTTAPAACGGAGGRVAAEVAGDVLQVGVAFVALLRACGGPLQTLRVHTLLGGRRDVVGLVQMLFFGGLKKCTKIMMG